MTAFNFVALSPTATEALRPRMRARLDVIAPLLTDKYKIPRGRTSGGAVRLANITNSRLPAKFAFADGGSISRTAQVLSRAFLYLAAEKNQPRVLAVLRAANSTQSKSAVSIIENMRRDGINNWADVLRLKAAAQAKEPPTPPQEPAPPIPHQAPEAPIPEPIAEAPAEEEFPEFAAEPLEDRISALVSELVMHLADLAAEKRTLHKRADDTDRKLRVLNLELQESETKAARLREELLAAEGAELEQFAARYPIIADALNKQAAELARQRADVAAKRVLAGLPMRFAWRSDAGRVEYSRSFREYLDGEVPPHEQARIRGSLQRFVSSAYGPNQPGFRTEKLEQHIDGIPSGARKSRVASEHRIIWSHVEGSGLVVIHRLYKKSDAPHGPGGNLKSGT